jgi:hypothetical protein
VAEAQFQGMIVLPCSVEKKMQELQQMDDCFAHSADQRQQARRKELFEPVEAVAEVQGVLAVVQYACSMLVLGHYFWVALELLVHLCTLPVS